MKRLAIVVVALAAWSCSEPPAARREVLEPTMGPGGPLEPVASSSDLSPGSVVVGGSDAEYKTALERRREELRSSLQAIPPGKAEEQREQYEKELELVQEKIEDSTKAFVEQQRNKRNALAAAELFLQRAEADSRWEIGYALRSGELSLARSIIQDNLTRLERQAKLAAQPPLGNERRPPAPAAPLEELRRLAGQAYLRLALLAESGADYEEAQRAYRFALDHSGDLAVSADALSGYAGLLRTLGREAEARDLTAQREELLRRAAP